MSKQREIIVRAFYKKSGTWVYFTLSQGFGSEEALQVYRDLVLDGAQFFQNTGLKDKNGKDIYESDIIKTGTDKLMVITWSEKFASFCIERDGWAFQHWFGEAFEAKDCEVVGNQFENPELLKP